MNLLEPRHPPDLNHRDKMRERVHKINPPLLLEHQPALQQLTVLLSPIA
jgi:hypothetical protein